MNDEKLKDFRDLCFETERLKNKIDFVIKMLHSIRDQSDYLTNKVHNLYSDCSKEGIDGITERS